MDRHSHLAPFLLLDLNNDVLQLIVDALSVKDASSFRRCSKRASLLAMRRAFAEATLRSSDLEKQVQRWESGAHPVPPSWIKTLRITAPPALPNAPEQPAGRSEAARSAAALLQLLVKTTMLRDFRCDGFRDLVRHEPRLHSAIAALPRLETLVLKGAVPATSSRVFDGETSAWLLRTLDSGFKSRLTHLSLATLDFQVAGADLVPRLPSLYALAVQSIKGDVSFLVELAPHLKILKVGRIRSPLHKTLELALGDRRWTTLDSLSGAVWDIRHLPPLCRAAVRRITITQPLDQHDAFSVEETLQPLKPCILEYPGMCEGTWFYRSHAYLRISNIAHRLFYLRLDETSTDSYTACIPAIEKAATGFTALLCLDIKPHSQQAITLSPRFAHSIPTLRFLLVDTSEIDQDEPWDEVTHRNTEALLPSPYPGIEVWDKTYVCGIRFAEYPLDKESDTRFAEFPPTAVVAQVRKAYREATFDTRFEVESRLFPGPRPHTCIPRPKREFNPYPFFDRTGRVFRPPRTMPEDV